MKTNRLDTAAAMRDLIKKTTFESIHKSLKDPELDAKTKAYLLQRMAAIIDSESTPPRG